MKWLGYQKIRVALNVATTNLTAVSYQRVSIQKYLAACLPHSQPASRGYIPYHTQTTLHINTLIPLLCTNGPLLTFPGPSLRPPPHMKRTIRQRPGENARPAAFRTWYKCYGDLAPNLTGPWVGRKDFCFCFFFPPMYHLPLSRMCCGVFYLFWIVSLCSLICYFMFISTKKWSKVEDIFIDWLIFLISSKNTNKYLSF